MGTLPNGTVRGNIKRFLRENERDVTGDVLEIGSRVVIDGAWWMNNRDIGNARSWTGIDSHAGQGVDRVMNAQCLEFPDNNFDCVICSEVLEHVEEPQKVISEINRVLRPTGAAIITTLFSFPVHGFPDDYWRFTPSCMQMLMRKADFRKIHVTTDGHYQLTLCDHGDGVESVDMFNHIFALGYK